ncbi:hypothetical protein KUTeg_001731 [Tegillarca granosa]|uniref:RING-type E3 ubiquitin transferase (cysteine targeting) n=1 Tax=Tegillarca granosa TaxID=220873 RepID=A0ABQ9FSA4_TEGGR|nr:hypothetical protein KUTeg_001731 [Tegillarca granosa]
MAGDDLKITPTPALRVSQSNVLVNYEPEVNALLKLIVWKFTVSLNESTIGQDILNLKYFSGKTLQLISRRQKYVYALILIGSPWLRDRSSNILKYFGLNKWKEQSQKILRWIEVTFKLANLLNFWCFYNKESFTL